METFALFIGLPALFLVCGLWFFLGISPRSAEFRIKSTVSLAVYYLIVVLYKLWG